MTPAEQIRKLLTEAYYLARDAHENCYSNISTPANKDAVLAKTYSCISKYATAAAIYWENPELTDKTFLKLLQCFEHLTNELRVFEQVQNNTTRIFLALQELEDLLDG